MESQGKACTRLRAPGLPHRCMNTQRPADHDPQPPAPAQHEEPPLDTTEPDIAPQAPGTHGPAGDVPPQR